MAPPGRGQQRHRRRTRCSARRPPTTGGGCPADRVWIVDPLDGTREFGEPDRHDWAVHVALWSAGELTAGAVALPGRWPTLLATDPVRRRCRPRSAAGRIASRSAGPAPAVVAPLADALGAAGWCRWARPATRPSAVLPGRGRRLRPRRRSVRVGLGGPGRRGPGRRAARLPARRLPAALQPARPAAARPRRLPPGARRAHAGGDATVRPRPRPMRRGRILDDVDLSPPRLPAEPAARRSRPSRSTSSARSSPSSSGRCCCSPAARTRSSCCELAAEGVRARPASRSRSCTSTPGTTSPRCSSSATSGSPSWACS